MKTLFRILLSSASAIYWVAIIIWDWYWRIAPQVKLPCKVISIGNIVAGGAGKTPLVIYIARLAVAAGYKTAVVARGYKRREKGLLEVTAESTWKTVGDEPLEIFRTVQGIRVYVCESKTRAAQKAAADGAQVIIVDDGFQHRRLARDIDIVCLDSNQPFGPGGYLPGGRLREPKSSLKRATALVFTSHDKDSQPIDQLFDGKKYQIFYSDTKISGFVRLGWNEIKSGETIVSQKSIAFCGLANPDKFRKSLQKANVSPAKFQTYDDHHRYSNFDIDFLIALAKNESANCLITTAKDAVKFDSVAFTETPLYYTQMSLALNDEVVFRKMLGL
jgi:tetraacyldisaccharide 4'-kinase